MVGDVKAEEAIEDSLSFAALIEWINYRIRVDDHNACCIPAGNEAFSFPPKVSLCTTVAFQFCLCLLHLIKPVRSVRAPASKHVANACPVPYHSEELRCHRHSVLHAIENTRVKRVT